MSASGVFKYCVGVLLVMAAGVGSMPAEADTDNSVHYVGAGHVPASQPGWERFQEIPEAAAPQDEAQGGQTALGSPLYKRIEDCFPAEPRNLFSGVDSVPGADGMPQPFAYGDAGGITDAARDAIRGQNTWMLWAEGNEDFWGWLQERGYGFVDFLVLLRSRDRDQRFHSAGLINQPGMRKAAASERILGLDLDVADGSAITLPQPSSDKDSGSSDLHAALPLPGKLPPRPQNHPDSTGTCDKCHGAPADKMPNPPFELAESLDEKYKDALRKLPRDGVDPNVYGYPSGVVGLRLFPNPDFFGTTPAASAARTHWNERVENTGDGFYDDPLDHRRPHLGTPVSGRDELRLLPRRPQSAAAAHGSRSAHVVEFIQHHRQPILDAAKAVRQFDQAR